MQNHHLSKLIITTTTASESEGFALRRLLKENWQQLLPDLTESFDEFCADDEVIHLPKIAISLEVDSMHSLVSDMPITDNEYLKDQIKTQVMQQVQEFKAAYNGRQNETVFYGECFDNNSNVNNEHIERLKNQTNTNKMSNGLLTWQDVKSYLNNGQLPWHIMQEESVKNLVKRDNSQSLHSSIQSLIKQNINACITGLYEEHSPQTINRLVQLCDDILRKSIFDYLVDHALSKSNLLKNEEVGEARQNSQALVSICEEIINKSTNPIDLTSALFTSLLSGNSETNTVNSIIIQDSILETLIPKAAKQFNTSENVLSTLSSAILPKSNDYKSAKIHRTNQGITQVLKTDKVKALENSSDDDLFKNATQVLFAGSIILYPYLTIFFKDLDYLSEDKTIKNNKQNSAVTLMVYLLTGKEQAFDYQLHFIKWLLGIPIGALISIEENSLTENEKALADTVLLSLKSHWSVLKNTSISTIRESFLQRSGMMKLDDEQCHLHIERKGIDVLIDQIPFSLSIIRLAWIKQPIIVTW
ncbi:contractile injection system tape measure protein [Candidatus Colwellia aromaticivorans]|uniref:contractile injection system tape measure protein n=1 Tax=Candidatus Colwellia aromaticivorans TaxID=2267621 RepID=UPI000DF2065F|nr:contractile injection system tape measure protein [Candidatus Colwellia aromaticivorans]